MHFLLDGFLKLWAWFFWRQRKQKRSHKKIGRLSVGNISP